MSKTLNRLLASNGLFCVDGRTGSPRDIVGNITPTVVGAPAMLAGQGIRCPSFSAPGHYLNYGTGSQFDLADLTQPRSWLYMLRANTGGSLDAFGKDANTGRGWAVLHNMGAGQLSMVIVDAWVGGSYMTCPVALTSARTDVLACFTYNGSKTGAGMLGYRDPGVTAAAGSGSVSAAGIVEAGTGLRIGNNYGGYPGIVDAKLFAMFNRVLTPAEVSQMFVEIRRETPPGLLDAPKRKFSFPYRTLTPAQATAQGLVLDTDFVRRSDGKVRNLAPTAYAGTLVGNPVPDTEGMRFDGVDDLLNFGDVTELNGASKAVVDWSMLAMESSVTSGDVIWGKNVVANQRFNVEFANPTPSSSLFIRAENGSPANATSPAGTFGSKRWSRFTLAFDGTQATNAERLRLFVEGTQVALTFTGSIPATLFNSAGSPFVLANDGLGSANKSNIVVRSLRVRTGIALTAQQVRAEYLEGAKRLLLDGRLRADGSCPVSLTAITTANTKVPGTIWQTNATVPTGVKVLEDSSTRERYLWVNSGELVTVQSEAFGSWYFEFMSSDGANFETMVVASLPGRFNAAGNNGYVVYQTTSGIALYRITNGAVGAVVIPYSSPSVYAGKPCRCFLSRSPTGRFDLYANDGSGWALLGSGTDTTHTTSYWATHRAAFDSNRLGDFMHFQGAMTPQEAEQLGLIPSVPAPALLWTRTFTTTKQAQSWVIRATAGAQYTFDWGDGTTTVTVGNGADQTITHNYGTAGTRQIQFVMADPTKLIKFDCANNGLTGSLPSFAAATAMTAFLCNGNTFSGTLPSFNTCTQLTQFYCGSNSFTGAFPSFSACSLLNNVHIGINSFSGTLSSFNHCTGLKFFYCYYNSFTGTIPSFDACSQLIDLYVGSNQFTAFAGTVIATTCTTVLFETNQLPAAEVNKILAILVANLGARPANGTLQLHGTGNAAPTGQGLIDQDLLLAKPWTVITNALPSSVPNTLLWQGEYYDARATFNTQPVLVNGDFAVDANWTKGAGWTIPGGYAERSAEVSTTALSQAGALVAIGNRIAATWDIAQLSAGGEFGIVFGGGSVAIRHAATGTYADEGTVTGNTTLYMDAKGGTAGRIANIRNLRNLSLSSYKPAYVSGTYAGTLMAQATPAYMSWKSSTWSAIQYGSDGDYNRWSAAASAAKCMHDATGGTLIVCAIINALAGVGKKSFYADNCSNSSPNVGIVLFEEAGKLAFRIANGGAFDPALATAGVEVEEKKVYVFAARVAAGANGVRVAKNGTGVLTGTAAAPSAANPTNQLTFGSIGSAATAFDGVISDVHLANRVLTDAELRLVGERMFVKALGASGCTVLGPWTTTDTTQSWTFTVTSGQVFGVVWGDGTYDSYVGTGASQTVTHTYAAPGTYTLNWYFKPTSVTAFNGSNNALSGAVPSFAAYTQLTLFQLTNGTLTGSLPDLSASAATLQTYKVTSNQFSGSIPDMSAFTQLRFYWINSNLLTGSIPSFAACTNLRQFVVRSNVGLTGTLPSFAACPALTDFDVGSCVGLGGALPSFAACTALVNFDCQGNAFIGALPDFSTCPLGYFDVSNNAFTARVAGTIATSCTWWKAIGNALTQSTVDDVLADMATDIGSRPVGGVLDLSGGTNATPSAAGLANKAIIAARPWTVNTN